MHSRSSRVKPLRGIALGVVVVLALPVLAVASWFFLVLAAISLFISALSFVVGSSRDPKADDAGVRRFIARSVQITGALVLLLYGLVPLCGIVVCWISGQDFEGGGPEWLSVYNFKGILAILGGALSAFSFGRLATVEIADWIEPSHDGEASPKPTTQSRGVTIDDESKHS